MKYRILEKRKYKKKCNKDQFVKKQISLNPYIKGLYQDYSLGRCVEVNRG